jgi:hypothetical protein
VLIKTMLPHSKDGFQALPQQVDYTCVTNAHMVGNGNDDNEEVAAVVDTTTTTRDRTSGKPLFRSKCHPDEIPDVARDFTWCDSFYKNDTDVIAVFDMNHKMLDRDAMFCYCRMFGIFIFCFVPFFIWIWISISFIVWIFFMLVPIFVAMSINEERIKNFRRRRSHFAIARQGIYYDQVDEPGSRKLMSRTVISYDDIQKSMVTEEKGCCRPNYQVVVYANNGQPSLSIEGLVETQIFVDIVNAMIERCRRRNESTNTEVPDSIETIEIEPIHEEDIVIAVAKLV